MRSLADALRSAPALATLGRRFLHRHSWHYAAAGLRSQPLLRECQLGSSSQATQERLKALRKMKASVPERRRSKGWPRGCEMQQQQTVPRG